MLIKEVALNNFRIYKGHHALPFIADVYKNIHIISGNNGYGKTTFLTSLIWGLYGKNIRDVDDVYKTEILELGGYSNYLKATMNRLAIQEGEDSFSVKIVLADVNIPNLPCNELVILRTCNYQKGTDNLEIFIDGQINELTREVGPDIFINDFLLPKEIAKFFFFDSEKIVALAELKSIESKRQLSKAYSEVLGIKKYEDLRNQLTDMRLRFRKSSASKEEQDRFNSLKKRLESIEKRQIIIEKELEDHKEQKAKALTASNEWQEKLIRQGSSITVEKLNELRAKKKELLEQKERLQVKLKECLDLAPFAILGKLTNEIKIQADKEKEQKEAEVDNQIFNKRSKEILKQFKEVGKINDIDKSVSKLYEKQLKNILDSYKKEDAIEKVDVLHDFSNEEYSRFNAIHQQLTTTYSADIQYLLKELRVNKSNYTRTSNKISNAESKEKDSIVISYREKKHKADQTLEKADTQIEALTKEKGALDQEYLTQGKIYKELARKIQVKERYKEKDKLAKQLIEELHVFIDKIKVERKESLEKRILENLQVLMHKQDFITKVEVIIEGELIDILLFNDRNERIDGDALSKGEQQLYATAILKALVDESNIEFPVFIDSPLQKFDATHARNIIEHFYPNVSKQVILFPLLNKEMSEQEYDLLLDRVKSATIINNVDEDKSELVTTSPKVLFEHYKTLYNHHVFEH